ncbi:RDD family protein [Pseudoflavitalea sp. G-6-1-2]|uniref:RDD family protein n=1 Tax=Pseudoflavitalea sp. G-6-1-2 TaxID=2728841 RepID=UPI00146F368C|nr:RDD family protein [Pseudoflavitalea sp. G-6-1-2]NML22523.1 RDD family protein [Pseudoflavitalea sp. G-6-1-2]
MAILKLDTGFNLEVEIAVAPFAKRLLAWIIDGAACVIYLFIMGAVAGFAAGGSFSWVYSIALLPYLLYHLLSEIFFNGASLGKMAIGIRVIAEDGGTPSINQYLIRWLFRLVDSPFGFMLMAFAQLLPWWCFPLIFTGILVTLLTPKSQRIGDLLAGTILIDTRNVTSIHDTIFQEVEVTYKPRYPEVMKMTDKDINTLKGILGTINSRNDMAMAMRIADRIKAKLNLQSDEDSYQFLHTLLKDYNYYSSR